MIPFTPQDLDYLLSPRAIRDRSRQIFDLACGGKTHFQVHLDRLPEVSDFVTDVTLKNYPDLKIPFHSRWGHFQVQVGKNGAKIDRLGTLLEPRLKGLPREERARVLLDLVVASVLLDAGSGPGWKYKEKDGSVFDRSEGLAVASFHMFLNGAFSSDPSSPLRVDARGLENLCLESLSQGFQVSSANPLAGVQGRLDLLRSLGKTMSRNAVHFGKTGRPGHLLDFCLIQSGGTGKLDAKILLRAVLDGLGPIWPGRIQLGETNLGDVWHHPLLGAQGSTQSLVVFHKLSQWLTYSLIEPIEDAGISITEVNELTGLAEYRNGGLLLDKGLISLRNAQDAEASHRPDSPLIIEWRALTIILLEKIAERVRSKLGKTESEMPLAKVLEGGTWWAGRKAAAELRSNGSPPLKIISDGTVF